MAAGIMLAASVWSLLLPAIARSQGRAAWVPPALGLILGAVGLLRLEDAAGQLLAGGPGHCGRMVLAVTLHNLPEGMVVGLAAALALHGDADAVSGALALSLGDDSQERPFEHHIYAYDIDMKAVNTARMNVKAAGLSQDISVEQQDIKDFKKPAEKSIIIMNPPYGERITTPNLLGTYHMIGEKLKREFGGNEAWVLSYREECFEQIGLKPSIKIPLYNGSLECELRKYTLFDGKLADFRREGGIVKTEEEKAEMAQKHRFKKNREFKERVSGNDFYSLKREAQANEEGDIRTFKFHSFEERRKPSRPRFDDDKREYSRPKRDHGRKDDFRKERRGAARKPDRRKRGFDEED